MGQEVGGRRVTREVLIECIPLPKSSGFKKSVMNYRVPCGNLPGTVPVSQSKNFTGKRMPPMPQTPDPSKVKYEKPIKLFNGNDLSGWKLIDEEKVNGFKVVNGTLMNDPVQPEDGEHISYGNIRTEKKFEDFNLKLEVNVPTGNNSDVYLCGLYEIQVVDSYGKVLDSHHLGAVYSRITPNMAAEKPAGE